MNNGEWGFELYDLEGILIVKKDGYRTEKLAEDAGIQYLNDKDIWDCKLKTVRKGERK